MIQYTTVCSLISRNTFTYTIYMSIFDYIGMYVSLFYSRRNSKVKLIRQYSYYVYIAYILCMFIYVSRIFVVKWEGWSESISLKAMPNEHSDAQGPLEMCLPLRCLWLFPFSVVYICISFKFLNLRIQVTNNCRWGLAVHVAIWSCWAGPPDTSYATWFIPPKWLRCCWDTGITSPGFLRGPTGINKCSLSHSHCSSGSMRDKVEAWNVGFGAFILDEMNHSQQSHFGVI